MRPPAERYQDLVSGRKRGVLVAAARGGLWLTSVPYGLAVRVRNRLYDAGRLRTHRVPVPVVSVGNLTVGGTGKTPCVEYLARFFRKRGIQVAILSRGYGGAGGPNDEALVLEENLPDVPHLLGADRASLAAMAVEELESELLILDDGFQHRRLARDLDVVLIDATNPWGFGYLLPRGLLREPRSGLKRAGAVVLTRCEQASGEDVQRLRVEVTRLTRPGTPVVEASHRPLKWLQHDRPPQPLDSMRGRAVIGFCGLGNPEAFRRTVAGLGLELRDFRTFPDHHAYTRECADDLRRWAGDFDPGTAAVTTQKDLVKLRTDRLGQCDLFALRVGMEITPGAEATGFEEKLIAICLAER